MAVGAAGRGAGAGTVHQGGNYGIRGVTDHGLQVKAVLGERGDSQGALPVGACWKPWAWEAGTWRIRT